MKHKVPRLRSAVASVRSGEGFTDDYNAVRLVYWGSFDDVRNAIDREKKLKGWRRKKKLWLIANFNPGWKDLAAEWYETQGPSTSLGMTK